MRSIIGKCGTASHTLHRTASQHRFFESLWSACPAFYNGFDIGHSASCSCPIYSGVLAFLGALVSWRHFSRKTYWLAADYEIIKVRGCRVMPFIHRIGESPFRKVFQKFFPYTNRNRERAFHIQLFEIFKISQTP